MAEIKQLTARQIAAGRVLVGLAQSQLAAAASIPIATLRKMEAGADEALEMSDELEAVRLALEEAGIQFIAESAGGGVGVRLRFTAQSMKRIDILENEGGTVAEDDDVI